MEEQRKLVEAPCPGCGKKRLRRPSRKDSLCYGCTTSANNTGKTGCKSNTWRGGTAKHSKGYVRVSSPGHPRQGKSGYVFEHILVMEKKLGRHLRPGESVHHKNGLRNDNRLNNLELWVRNHPAGQRVQDLVDWVIREYPERIRASFDL